MSPFLGGGQDGPRTGKSDPRREESEEWLTWGRWGRVPADTGRQRDSPRASDVRPRNRLWACDLQNGTRTRYVLSRRGHGICWSGRRKSVQLPAPGRRVLPWSAPRTAKGPSELSSSKDLVIGGEFPGKRTWSACSLARCPLLLPTRCRIPRTRWPGRPLGEEGGPGRLCLRKPARCFISAPTGGRDHLGS